MYQLSDKTEYADACKCVLYFVFTDIRLTLKKTVLFAEDKLDDGNPIVLQVTINDDEVSSIYIFAEGIFSMCLTFVVFRGVLFLELEQKFHKI